MNEIPVCESCQGPADVRLADGSTWCASCDVALRRLGYDNAPYDWIGLRAVLPEETNP